MTALLWLRGTSPLATTALLRLRGGSPDGTATLLPDDGSADGPRYPLSRGLRCSPSRHAWAHPRPRPRATHCVSGHCHGDAVVSRDWGDEPERRFGPWCLFGRSSPDKPFVGSHCGMSFRVELAGLHRNGFRPLVMVRIEPPATGAFVALRVVLHYGTRA